ncbi:TIGR01777 family oxidoreductase [Parapedobacter sp. DT-150]|uniref:TIGR01777 family oxidoreductase n=1 Tax=Parapedobacter sp. DT-150 TaxID=3396162 RepID=UPI003F1B75CF
MEMNKRVLVTGASGLIGRALMPVLVERGYFVNALSRTKRVSDLSGVQFFEWDVSADQVDPACLDGVTAIIHLAGENIGALPWSNKRKQLILASRTEPIELLYRLLKQQAAPPVKAVISASATGYYNDRGDEWMTEDKPPANDFLGQTCAAWERAVSRGRDMGLRTVSLRSGVVLSAEGGIYRKFADLIKRGLGIVPGTGNQWMPWIHIDDVVSLYLFALEHNGIHGVYNMSAPEQISFSTFVRAIAKQQGRSWLPKVPAFMLKTILGQMSELLLSSTRVSTEKIRNTGFQFSYPTFEGALEAIGRKT